MQEDKELMDKVDYALGESTEIYRILQDRLDLYKEAEKYPVSGYYKLLLNSMK